MMAGLFVLPSLLNIIIPPPSVYAAADSPEDQLERWFYYRAMRACFEKPDWGRTAEVPGQDDQDGSRTAGEINDGDLMPGGYPYQNSKEGIGYLAKDLDGLDGNDGTVQCSDNNLWKEGASIFGFPNVLSLICAMNEADTNNKIDPEGDAGDCDEAASIRFHHVEDSGSAFQQMLTKALENPAAGEHGGDGDRPSFDFNSNQGTGYTYKSLLYVLGKKSLETFCGGSLDSANANDSYDGDSKAVSVYIVQSDGTIKESGVGGAGFSHSYAITKRDNESDDVSDVYYANGGNSNEADNRSCADMARWTREGAREYATWLAEYGQDDTDDDGDSDNTAPEEDGTTCNVDGIGWIVCPVMTFIAKLNDAAFGFLNNFLTIEPELLTDQNARTAWEAFRNFANVAFAISFLIIIYSQLTGAGISNYGLKKLLPKLIIAAILVNLSYYICQIAVDLSNIVGSGIYNFFKNIPIGVENGEAASNASGVWESLVVGILIAGAFIALIAIVIFAPAALLAFALAVLILVARKAFLIILVVISPLAFVAYLLPNTEQWFKRWWKAFSTMLMLFPVVGAVFGGSVLASNILTNVAEQSSGDDKQMLLVVALGVMAIPLFAIPSLVKGSMAAAGAVGARLSGLQDRANRYGGKKIGQSRIGEAKTAFGARRQQRKVDARLGNGRVTKAGQFLSKRGLYGGKTLEAIGGAGAKFDQSSLGRRFGGDRGAAAAVYEQNKFKNEAVERSMALLQENKAADVVTKAREQLIAANKSGDVIGARAATRVLAQQTGSRGIDQLHSAISEIEKDGGTLHDNIGESVKHEVTAAGLKAKNRSLDKWSREEPTPTGTKLGDYDADRRSVSGLNEAELAGHSGAMLKTYAQSGALDSDSATRVLAAHQKGTVHLDEEKLSILQGVAGAAPPPPPPTPPPPPSP